METRRRIGLAVAALLGLVGVRAARPAPRVKKGLIALTLRDEGGRLQIFTEKPDGSGRRQLTFEGDNGRPDWSPDGRKIAFGTFRNRMSFIGVMDADGSHQRLLVQGNPAPDWSPDGRRIAFSYPTPPSEGRPAARSGRWTSTAGTSGSSRGPPPSRAARHGHPTAGRWSSSASITPARRRTRSRKSASWTRTGGSERVLTVRDRVNVRRERDGATRMLETAHDANAPAWSPVDDRIAFWSGIETRYGQVWTIHADGTHSRQLTEDPNHRNSDDPSWSPDGKQILFSTGWRGRNELWVMDANGQHERKVSDIDAAPFPGRASWQPLAGGGRRLKN